MTGKNVYFSIIIPTLNEERNVEGAIKSVLKQSFKNFEIIVIDGNSTDKTVKIAKRYCKTLIAPKRGLANQENYGIKYAKGEFVCILHADTRIVNNTLKKIYVATKDDRHIVAGTCYLKCDDDSIKFKMLLRLISFFFIIFKTGGCFFFARKSVFDRIKFRNKYLVEDFDFFNRVKKLGKYKFIVDTHSITSARRLKNQGILKTTIKFAMACFDVMFNIKFVNKRDFYNVNYEYS